MNELRDFKKKHPKKFNDISKIPNKARCGRKLPDSQQLTLFDTETEEINYSLQNTSLTYLKSKNHPGIFCLITPEMNIIETNFLQAVKLFKASDSEQAIALHKLHHKQVLAALDFFKSEKNQENVKIVSRKNLSPAENKAITNINALVRIAPTEQKRKTLIRTLEIIKKGTFASKGLPKSINDYFTSKRELVKEPEKFIEQLFITVLDRYDLSPASEETPQLDKAHEGIINPRIVLTQSFS